METRSVRTFDQYISHLHVSSYGYIFCAGSSPVLSVKNNLFYVLYVLLIKQLLRLVGILGSYKPVYPHKWGG